ncbi:MAG: Hsp70 family protein [Pedobacter sp.]
MNNFLYGIDFGTTNSALSIYNEDSKEIVETIIIPSLLYFFADQSSSAPLNYVVGKEAIDAYVSDGMSGRFMKSIKRILPRSSFIETKVHNTKLNASDLVTLILKELKRRADSITGVDCRKAVIGRPVFFDDDDTTKDSLAQNRLNKAATNADFSEVRFQFEPIGAAFAYERTLKQKEKVLVADLGGGTTDFTFLSLDPTRAGEKERQKDIIANGGIYIGGDSFDSSFMWDKGTPYFGKHTLYEAAPGKMLNVPVSLFANICSWEQMNFFNGQKIKNDIQNYYHYSKQDKKFKNLITLTENNLGYSLFQSIEQSKLELSGSHHTQFSYSKMGIDINEGVSRVEYDQIISRDLNKISTYLEDFLSKNSIQTSDIDSLFLTGGTSMVSAVRNLFNSRFPDKPIHSGDNFISVAKGLAYSGYLFEED